MMDERLTANALEKALKDAVIHGVGFMRVLPDGRVDYIDHRSVLLVDPDRIKESE